MVLKLGTLWKVDQENLRSFEMALEKDGKDHWADCVRN
jgi:hypothetical protein